MSTEALLNTVIGILNANVVPVINDTNTAVNDFNKEAQKTMKQAQAIMTRLDPILDSITRIEDFIFALLIVTAVMLLAFFIFWFCRHVVPLMSNKHAHPHNAENVMRDLTETPVRLQPNVPIKAERFPVKAERFPIKAERFPVKAEPLPKSRFPVGEFNKQLQKDFGASF